MALTDIQVKNAKASNKSRKLSDEKGLYLYISVAGGKSWCFDYCFFGKRKTLTIGGYPTVGLADARRLRDEAKKKLYEGLDPSLSKKRDQLAAKAAAGHTFAVIADECIDKLRRGKLAEPTITKNKWMLKDLAEKLGSCPNPNNST